MLPSQDLDEVPKALDCFGTVRLDHDQLIALLVGGEPDLAAEALPAPFVKPEHRLKYRRSSVTSLREEEIVDEKALFLKFWEREAPATRKVLSRIPQQRSDYRPDPKARTAREIAWLIVREEIILAEGLAKGVLEWVELPTPAAVSEIVDTYDRHHDDLTRKLHALDAARWEQSVPFTFGGKEVMKASGYENAWGFLFDVIHHRGQLSAYLRPMGSTVPQIYGPSADEP